jgi:hypothetical protein
VTWVIPWPTPLPSAVACSLNRAVATTQLPVSRVIASSMIRIAMVEPPLTERSGKPGPTQGPTLPDFARPSETSPDLKSL